MKYFYFILNPLGLIVVIKKVIFCDEAYTLCLCLVILFLWPLQALKPAEGKHKFSKSYGKFVQYLHKIPVAKITAGNLHENHQKFLLFKSWNISTYIPLGTKVLRVGWNNRNSLQKSVDFLLIQEQWQFLSIFVESACSYFHLNKGFFCKNPQNFLLL